MHSFSDGVLIGRDEELAKLAGLLAAPRTRLLTITGPGGVGKTRLAAAAVETARAFYPDGAVLVPLVAVAEPERVLPAIATAAGLVDQEERLADALLGWIGGRRVLLALDNLEHLLAAAPRLAQLLRAAPGVTILATSRRPLQIAGETLIDLAPLSLARTSENPGPEYESPAVRLFLQRAAETPGSRPIQPSALPAIAEICARIDGLPLAIELAAAWTRSVAPRALLARMNPRLPRLKGGVSDDRRHDTMRDAIAWSHALLTPEEQALFRRLSIFTGGFTFRMVEQMIAGREAGAGYPWSDGYGIAFPFTDFAGDPTTPERDRQDPSFARELARIELDPLDGLTALIDQSLIRRSGDERYDLLETIREFGLEQLDLLGETGAVRHAHAAVMLAFAEASAESIWSSTNRRRETAGVGLEFPNLRAALTWATGQGEPAAELSQRLAGVLWSIWQTRGAVSEGRGWMERAYGIPGGPAWARAIHMPGFGFLCWIQGDDEQATTILNHAVSLSAEVPESNLLGTGHFMLALVAWRRGPEAIFEMLDHLEIAENHYLRCKDNNGIGVVQLAYGAVERSSNSAAEALARFERASVLFRETGYQWGLATSRYYAGEALRDLSAGDPKRLPEAIRLLREGLRLYAELGDNWGMGGAISALACIALSEGDRELAARLFGAANAMLEKMGAFLPPTDLDFYRAAAAALRGQMGGVLFDHCLAEGRALSPDEAIALADPDGPPALPKLTAIQESVARGLLAGLDATRIAQKRGRSRSSTYEVIKLLKAKLGVDKDEEIGPKALELGLIKPDNPGPKPPKKPGPRK